MVNLIDHPVEAPKGAAEGIQALRSALAGCADEEVLPPGAQLERLRTYLEPISRSATTRPTLACPIWISSP